MDLMPQGLLMEDPFCSARFLVIPQTLGLDYIP